MSYSLFQLKSSLHGLQGCAPLHCGGFCNVLEYDLASPLDLILHQLHAVLPLLSGGLLKIFRESMESLVVTTEVRGLDKSFYLFVLLNVTTMFFSGHDDITDSLTMER